VLGATLVVLMQSGLSLLSTSWVLYIGVLFIVMVMYAPGGIVGILGEHAPIARIGRLRELILPYVRILVPALITVFGFVLLVELTSFVTIGSSQGKQFKVGSLMIDAAAAQPWMLAVASLVLGGLWLWWASRGFMRVWDGLIADAKTLEGAAQ
jgi:branched-chain amino acid transport system permease protein